MAQEQCLSERQKDCFCIAAILGILFIRFFKTIVSSKAISKLFLIAHWDSLFYPLRLGQNFSMDPSLVQQAIPNRFFVSDYWHHGIPLWNQYSGFGVPLLADPQTFVFSLTQTIFTIFPGMHTWDMILILELAIGAISTYLLCRQFELNAIGPLIAALLFTFCPWLQWQHELLGTGICFAPLVFLFFVRLGKCNSLGWAILAGIAASIDILASHPEIAFITVLSSTIVVFLVSYYNDPSKFSFLSNFYKIAVTGLVAFGISAPMLIPFAEYLANGESYKMVTIASAGLPLQAIISNYLFPFYTKGSLYFGPLSWWGLAAALCFLNKSNRFTIPLIVCLGASIIAVTRFMPFQILFSIPPLSMTFGTYCLPEYILFMSAVSGLGISCLLDNIGMIKKGIAMDGTSPLKIAIVSITVLILSVIPLLYVPWHHNNMALGFDQTFEPPRFAFKQWLFNAYFMVAMFAVLWLTIRNKAFNNSGKWKPLSSFVFITLGISNLIIVSSNCLPIRPAFSYPDNLPIKINCQDRIISAGNHLFKPNTNLIYKLSMVQMLNPLCPKGFMAFIRACGGQVDQYTQTFPLVISRLLNVTGVRTILSMQPILDENVLSAQVSHGSLSKKIPSSTVDYNGNLGLDKIQVLYDKPSGAVFCRMQVRANAEQAGNYHLCLGLEDLNGKSVSFIEPVPISISTASQEIYCSGLLPKNLQHWQVSLKVLRDKDCCFIAPMSVPCGIVRRDGSWLLGKNNQTGLFTKINNNRFQLLSNSNGILVYKNRDALNRYFFVNKIKWVEQREEALVYMKEHAGELDNIVVLENMQKKPLEKMLTQTSIDVSKGTVEKLDDTDENNHFALFPALTLQTDAAKTALLVISNLYYPGWKVYLDGLPGQIFRADYLFQSIVIPPGKHLVRFEYRPASFAIGITIFIITVLVLLAYAYKTFSQRVNSSR